MQLDQTKIGVYIHHLRCQLGITQAALGERLGVSPQSVSNWERGESLPDITILPNLAGILRCSVDSILLGGEGCIGYRHHVTVAQMREVMESFSRIGMLLGLDHFIYRTIVDALNTRMNTDIEPAFTDAHLAEVFMVEMLLSCVANGDYVDPQDVKAHLKDSRARTCLLEALKDQGIC